jgi:hypothetical protein
MSQISMADLLDNVLFDKPIKPVVKPIVETEIDVKKILGEADEETLNQIAAEVGGQPESATPTPEPTPTEQSPSQTVQPIPDEGVASGTLEDYVERARKITKEHEPKGDLVLEIALQLEEKSCGKLQIGSEEYETITGWKIILDKFGIEYKAVPDAIKSFRIDCETKYSQTESDSVGISVELSGDGETLGIQVFYNEEGNIMDDLEQALNEFNRRYREYIITAINEKVRV